MNATTIAGALLHVRNFTQFVLNGAPEAHQSTDEQVLDSLLIHRQALISTGYIYDVHWLLPRILPTTMMLSITNSERYKLLSAVTAYHTLSNRDPKPVAIDWLQLEPSFREIASTDPLVRFVSLCYLYLILRNARQYDELDAIYTAAFGAAEAIRDSGVREEQLGYITYNKARYLSTIGGHDHDSKMLYIEAGHHRLNYFASLKQDSISYVAAAQQVAKIRIDWQKFYGGSTIEECPVSEETLTKMRDICAGSIYQFSVTKPTT